MRRFDLVTVITVLAVCVWAGTALAWEFTYECNDFPTLEGWELITGFNDDMAIVTDPDDPANNLLHITSYDGPDVAEDEGNKSLYDRSRPQVRLDYLWNPTEIGVTIELRVKETEGGFFLELYDAGGGRYRCVETIPPFDIWDSGGVGQVAEVFLEEWNVFRLIVSGDGFWLYINDELKIDGDGEVSDYADETNACRFGHSGGSGPAEQQDADIWVDYIYIDTTGAFHPGLEPWETAVQGGSWGKIKALF